MRREDARGKKLAGVPVLAVEVLSASTRSKDRVIKQKIYLDAGVPSFWIFDPGDLDDEPTEPSFEAYELRGAAYVQVATVTGNERATVQTPYPVTICPAEIVSG